MQKPSSARTQSTPLSDLVLSQLRGTLVGPGVHRERRASSERRRPSLWSALYGGMRPRRRELRRALDASQPIVDFHAKHLLGVALAILFLCFADAALTLTLLKVGASELNPIMAKLLSIDVTLFTGAKMALTGTGIVVLVLLSRFRLFGEIRVAQGLYGILAGYLMLVLYELLLFSSHFA
jgi:hypothetical protein